MFEYWRDLKKRIISRFKENAENIKAGSVLVVILGLWMLQGIGIFLGVCRAVSFEMPYVLIAAAVTLFTLLGEWYLAADYLDWRGKRDVLEHGTH